MFHLEFLFPMAYSLTFPVRWAPQLLASSGHYQPGAQSSTCAGNQATAYELCFMCSTLILPVYLPGTPEPASTVPGTAAFANTTAGRALLFR